MKVTYRQACKEARAKLNELARKHEREWEAAVDREVAKAERCHYRGKQWSEVYCDIISGVYKD